jgi:hypothetical protein
VKLPSAVMVAISKGEHMKNKKRDKKIFQFHSISSPDDFVVRIKEEAVISNLKIGQNGTDFDLQLGSNHGGKIVYRATVSADENGGSHISGEITTIPWIDKLNKKENIFERIFRILFQILFCIVVSPFVLLFLVCYGIYTLFVGLVCDKRTEPTEEEKLCDFMISQMCCKQKEE